jgi:hypothetical protein
MIRPVLCCNYQATLIPSDALLTLTMVPQLHCSAQQLCTESELALGASGCHREGVKRSRDANFQVCVGAALAFAVAAMLNVRGDGARWHVFTRGPLAGRDCFTRTGLDLQEPRAA